jgi:hypothetical protein
VRLIKVTDQASIQLTRLVARNITSLTCGFPDRDRGAVSSAVTFTSMALALSFVVTRAIVFGLSRIWGWDDIATGLATVRKPQHIQKDFS